MNHRILLVQLADLGDLILTTPAIAALREAQPEAHLTLLTTSHTAPVINGLNLVNEIITFDRKQFNQSKGFFKPSNLRRIWRVGRYDSVVFFHHFTLKAGTLKFAVIALASRAKRRIGLQNGNGWFLTESIPDEGFGVKHQAQYWLDLVGLLGAKTEPRLAVVAMTVSPNTHPKPRIVIHAGSGGFSLARRWSPEKFAIVGDTLQRELNAEIVLVGGKSDDSATVGQLMQSPAVDLIGKTTLAELAGVLHAADLFIGAESGVMHLAAASGVPMVNIFGPGNHLAWGAWTPKQIVVRSAPECSPCMFVGHDLGLRDGCAARTCLKMVTAEQVIAAAKQVLAGEYPENNQPVPDRWHKRITILGLPVDAITYAEWLDLIDQWVKHSERARHVCTTNPEFMVTAQRDTLFRSILERCDLCVPDGIGLLYAARWLGQQLPERVTGSDGVPKIAERAAQTGWRLFLLGAAPGIAEKAAAVLTEQYPGLQIAGVYAGSPLAGEEDAIVERINSSQADILLVAYGAPQQDKWIARNLPRLQVRMAMGVGGAFDFIAGIIPRAPMWMRQMGFEWLYRLYLQPWRIKRQLRLPIFVLMVIRERLYQQQNPHRDLKDQ